MSNQANFFEALGATIPETEIATKGNLSYLSASTAMRLAHRPVVDFVDFNDKPFLECLGGALVAVDLQVPGTDSVQRMWLPVMDRDTATLPLAQVTSTDINNSRQRCLVKAIATVYGVGMSVYLGFDGDGSKAVKALGLNPESILEEAAPVIATLREGGQPYIEWGVGLAACRLTDPTFFWEVVMWDGQPFREVLGGIMVDVDTVYFGKRQRLSLPLMDAAFNQIPADKASVFDWNKTVMRALAKCIAFNTGYGLTVYADDFGKDESKDAKGAAKAGKPTKAAKTDASPAPAAKAEAPASAPKAEAEKPAAPAPAAPKSEAAAEAPSNDAVTRFKGVMQNRRDVGGVQGLISLFEALAVSTKFDVKDKPACFAVLIPAVTAVVGKDEITSLLVAVKAQNAMQYLDQSTRDIVAAKLTAVALASGLADSDEALQKVPAALVEAGVAVDAEDIQRLAKLGNVPTETMDLLSAVTEAANA